MACQVLSQLYPERTMYTIKEAAARTRVPIALLRAWERRYRIVAPARTAGGYRLYDEDAIQRLATMRRLVDDGWTPSVAAAAILRGEVPSDPASPSPSGASDIDRPARDGVAGTVDSFVSAAIDLDPVALEAALDEMFATGGFESVAERLVLPALTAIGDAWQEGRLTVAGEHAASHAVLRRLAGAYQAAGRSPSGRGGVIVGLPPGTRHELAALAFAVAARRAGLPVLYLGPDLPIDDWISTVRRARPSAAVIAAPTATDAPQAAAAALAIESADDSVLVAFGGRGGEAARTRLPEGDRVMVMPDGVIDAVDRLRTALSERSPRQAAGAPSSGPLRTGTRRRPAGSARPEVSAERRRRASS